MSLSNVVPQATSVSASSPQGDGTPSLRLPLTGHSGAARPQQEEPPAPVKVEAPYTRVSSKPCGPGSPFALPLAPTTRRANTPTPASHRRHQHQQQPQEQEDSQSSHYGFSSHQTSGSSDVGSSGLGGSEVFNGTRVHQVAPHDASSFSVGSDGVVVVAKPTSEAFRKKYTVCLSSPRRSSPRASSCGASSRYSHQPATTTPAPPAAPPVVAAETDQLRADLALALSRISALEKERTTFAASTVAAPEGQHEASNTRCEKNKMTSKEEPAHNKVAAPNAADAVKQTYVGKELRVRGSRTGTPAPTTEPRTKPRLNTTPLRRTSTVPALVATGTTMRDKTRRTGWNTNFGHGTQALNPGRAPVSATALASSDRASTPTMSSSARCRRVGSSTGEASQLPSDYPSRPPLGANSGAVAVNCNAPAPKNSVQLFVQDCEVTRERDGTVKLRHYLAGGEPESNSTVADPIANWEDGQGGGAGARPGLTSGPTTPRSHIKTPAAVTVVRLNRQSSMCSSTGSNGGSIASANSASGGKKKSISQSRIVAAIETFLRKVDPLRACHARAIAHAMRYDQEGLRRKLAADYGWTEKALQVRYML